MKKKTKERKRLPILEVIRDIKNYRSWVKTIKEERSRASSKFHQYDLNHNYFYVLYVPITLPQEDSALPDHIKRLRIIETLTPIHQYLDIDLGFADYIVPEFNQFYDDEGEPTLTYGIVYRFAFKKLSLSWALSRAFFIGLLIWILTKWPILPSIWGFIT